MLKNNNVDDFVNLCHQNVNLCQQKTALLPE